MVENICNHKSDKDLIPRIYRTPTIQQQRDNKILKWSKD